MGPSSQVTENFLWLLFDRCLLCCCRFSSFTKKKHFVSFTVLFKCIFEENCQQSICILSLFFILCLHPSKDKWLSSKATNVNKVTERYNWKKSLYTILSCYVQLSGSPWNYNKSMHQMILIVHLSYCYWLCAMKKIASDSYKMTWEGHTIHAVELQYYLGNARISCSRTLCES